MKLSELGLKQKPQTKYFEGGYVAFAVREGKLQYKIVFASKNYTGTLFTSYVLNKEHLERLLSFKVIDEALQA